MMTTTTTTTTNSTTTTYPSPPPTTNTLPLAQRKRLLKSSRKLESVLGATPLVLEIDIGGPFDLTTSSTSATSKTRPPITPRTRAHRRRGQLFEGSSSASSSSDSEGASSDCNSETTLLNLNLHPAHGNDDSGDESDAGSYVFVPSSTPRALYQPQHIPSAVSGAPMPPPKDRNRKRSKSEAAPTSKNSSSKARPLVAAPPVPSLPLIVNTTGGKGAVKALAQPILFRLRSVPVPPSPPSHSRAQSDSPSVASTTASKHSKSASDDLRSPLSPLFDPARASLASLASVQDSDAVREAKEREVRRKRLAKVARTLGENVPPELVFGVPKPSSSPAKSKRKDSVASRRAANASAAVAAPTPLPARKTVAQTGTIGLSGKRKHRPRSLSVPVSYGQVAALSGKTGAVVIEQEGLDIEPETTAIPSVTLTTPDSTTPTAVAVPTPKASTYTTRARSHSKSHSHSAISGAGTAPRSPYGLQREGGGYYSALEVGTGLNDDKGKYKPRAERRAAFASLIGRPAPASASTSELGRYPDDAVNEHGVYVARATASLDIQRSAATPLDYVWGKKKKGEDGEEEWRRKEREWSGEWNVKDMGDVKRKLRELKGR